MWKHAAYKILTDELKVYQSLSYDELTTLVGETHDSLVRAEEGIVYSLSISVRELNDRDRGLYVRGSIAVADTEPLKNLVETIVVRCPAAK